jgi:hypothetical protein
MRCCAITKKNTHCLKTTTHGNFCHCHTMKNYGVVTTLKKIEECSICISNVDDEIKLSNCAHVFCKKCICKWSVDNHSCPNCRTSFSAIEVNNFYNLCIQYGFYYNFTLKRYYIATLESHKYDILIQYLVTHCLYDKSRVSYVIYGIDSFTTFAKTFDFPIDEEDMLSVVHVIQIPSYKENPDGDFTEAIEFII